MFLVVVHHPFSAKLPDGDTIDTRRHNCISYRIYRQFPYDGYIAPADLEEADPYGTSGGESSEESTESESEEYSPTPRQAGLGAIRVSYFISLIWFNFILVKLLQQPLRRQVPASSSVIRNLSEGLLSAAEAHQRLPSHAAPTSIPQAAPTSIPQASPASIIPTGSLIMSRFLPSSIWDNNWTPPPNMNRIEDLMTIEDVGRYVYDTVSSPGRLSIRGKSVHELATRFQSEVAFAASSKDFSRLFSADREFIM